jgi:hypothetical protein
MTKSSSTFPTDNDLVLELRTIMKSKNLYQETKSTIIDALEKRFKCNLESKKEFIAMQIDALLQ